jgi:hypothetical protein
MVGPGNFVAVIAAAEDEGNVSDTPTDFCWISASLTNASCTEHLITAS